MKISDKKSNRTAIYGRCVKYVPITIDACKVIDDWPLITVFVHVWMPLTTVSYNVTTKNRWLMVKLANHQPPILYLNYGQLLVKR